MTIASVVFDPTRVHLGELSQPPIHIPFVARPKYCHDLSIVGHIVDHPVISHAGPPADTTT